jgi:signal transduction histidine kinase/CheY-like chemotaxis protein
MRLDDGPRAYGLALFMTAASVAATRLTWPFFSAAPFAPVFGAVAVVSHWGGGSAGLLSAALGALGLALLFPAVPPFGWNSPPLFIYFAIAVIGNRLIVGRNRAAAALQASEAELRTTLNQVRESEEQLRHAQKMEAVGQLAAGVAHNFNNLLQVTMGYADVLADRFRHDEADRVAIAEIRKATERGAALTRQLMALGRHHEPRIARVDLDETIGGLHDMLSRVAREDVELKTALRSDAAAVMMDPVDLEQIVINLVINARDALPAGGAIRIDSVRYAVSDTERPAGESVPPGDYVRVRVADNGTGMTPEVQSHLFEPFFTTKEVGQGTGLGLAFVHGVAKHAGGFTSVDTAPGKGTTVSVFLPIAPFTAPLAAPPAAPVPKPQAASAATILLVEDESGVRNTTERILKRAGYRVLAAANAAEASALFDVHSGSLDLLLTDVVMPGMHGPELAARLAAIRPSLPVIFVSGHIDSMPSLPVVSSRAAFVAKPFTAASLVEAVEGLLRADQA